MGVGSQDRGAALEEVTLGGVSFLQQKWFLRVLGSDSIRDISRRFSIGDLSAKLLLARDVANDIENFLAPTLRHYLPDPYIFGDMEKAAERVYAAILSNESIILYGDYDVDGATSVSMLESYLRQLGHDNLRIYIPERHSDGYGVNLGAVDIFGTEGHHLMITMDCGTSSLGALSRAHDLGIEVIILDHHKPDSSLPINFALVNPNCESGRASEYGTLAAVGVSFLFLVAMNRLLRERGFFEGVLEELNLLQFLDLVALGTVCDVVPLRGLNRAFVYQGLRVMNRKERLGLRALIEVSGLERVDAGALAFHLGPRLNAASRMGFSGLAHGLLSSCDIDEATGLAFRLNELNIERQLLQSEQMSEVNLKVHDYFSDNVARGKYHITVFGDGWDAGLVGILAGRVRDQYKFPSIVIGFAGDEGRGSGRSVSGVDLGSAVIAAREAGLLVSGGGHGMAIGLTIMRDKLSAFCDFITAHISSQLCGGELSSDLILDFELSLSSITGDLFSELEVLSPYGSGHATPRPLFRGVRVGDVKLLKERHVSCRLYDSSGSSVRGIIFDGVHHILGGVLLGARGSDEFHIVGRVMPPYGSSRLGSIVIEDMFRVV